MTSVLESLAFQVARTHYQFDKETDGLISLRVLNLRGSQFTHSCRRVNLN